jgi:hypothetical protein
MKKPFKVTINVLAYSQDDAQAKVDLLLQMGAFIKDFNVTDLASSMIKSFVISKVGELTEKKKLGTS